MVHGSEVARRAPYGASPVVGARGARTRARIVEAALGVFAAHGYHDANIEQIAAAAGCSRPTLYQYFSGKEALFRALADDVGRQVVELTESLRPVTADASGRAAVVGWMRAFADLYDDMSPVFTASSAVARVDPSVAGAAAPIEVGLARALHRHLVAVDVADPAAMAEIVATMIVRANLLRIGSGGLIGRRRFVEALGATVHRALVGPVPELDGRGGAAPPARPPRLRRRAPDLAREAAGGRDLSPQGERTRVRIAQAGVAVFPRLGFHDTRVDDLVEAAGVSHGTFYRYFESKDDLFRELATQAADELVRCIDAFPGGDDARALRGWLGEWFDLYAAHGGIIAIWRETRFPDPPLEELTRQVADVALSRLLDALGERAVGDPLVDAMAFLGLVETVPHDVHSGGSPDRRHAIEALAAVIRRAFLGLDAA